MNYKLGRLPRAYNPSIPHMSALLAGMTLAPPPAAVDYTLGMPADLGMMKNDSLGDCTCAAWGHAVQVWSFNGHPPMQTPSDADIETLYERACNFDPSQTQPDGSNPTDQGGVEQDVLTYLLNTGLDGNRLAAFVEVDPRNLDDVKRSLYQCGVVYIGFNVPAYIVPPDVPPLSTWDWEPTGDQTIVGGHAVVLTGYDSAAKRFKARSWGVSYDMTEAFFAQFVDEVYALADAQWITLGGISVAGLTLPQLEDLMTALKAAA
jgi:hypothetical protein